MPQKNLVLRVIFHRVCGKNFLNFFVCVRKKGHAGVRSNIDVIFTLFGGGGRGRGREGEESGKRCCDILLFKKILKEKLF